MDIHEWQHFPMNEEANRKRPWDVISTSTSAEAIVPLSRVNTFHDEREPSRSPEWKRRCSTVQTEGANVWDTSMQTSLWLAQQNNLDTINPMTREPKGQRRQSRPSEEGYRNAVPGTPNGPRNWPQYGDDVHKGPSDDRASATRRLSPPARPASGYENPHHLLTSSSVFPISQDGVARRPSVVPGADQRCDKRCQDEPMWRDGASCVSKLAESLIAGSMFEVIAQYRGDGARHEQTPLVAEVHRILELLQEANGLARHVLQTAPSYLRDEKGSSLNGNRRAEEIHSSLEVMKRRFLADPHDDIKRQRRDSVDATYGHEPQGYPPMAHDSGNTDPRSGLSTLDVSADRLPPIRTHTPSQASPDDFNTRLPSMKPPPTPGRQLPSPPGRSHPSPPSYNIPSPSSLLYPQSLPSGNAAPQQQPLSTILHPLSPTPSSSLGTTTGPTTALQAHTAALQHEVSVKKYALQTLQSEHDKLLAALRRSQTRAHTLEEKQVNSDLEVNQLSEERVRLLAQIAELEQTITEVSKARDEFRQAAVKEGAQYVKIVRMASRLEMMAGDERKEWKRQMAESKAKTDALQSRLQSSSSAHAEGSVEARAAHDGPVEELKLDVQRLRARCAGYEAVMRDIRAEGQRFGEAVATLGSAGGQILASVDAAVANFGRV